MISCENQQKEQKVIKPKVQIVKSKKSQPEQPIIDYDTLRWSEITEEDIGISLDIKYATTDNFMQQKVYDCGRCFLEPRLAAAIRRIAKKINKEKGYSLKLYDCYRPKSYQQRLWDIKPDARYVTPPKRGSYHSRGLSVDLTILDQEGKTLDMGTPYDSFSKLSHTNHNNLPENVIKNRNLLKKLMKSEGLKGIRTEWWHYSLYDKSIDLEEWIWPCK